MSADKDQKQTKPRVTGRPLEYTPVIGDAICERLCDGESLRKICEDESMPARSTVFRWLSIVTAFSDQYARAREAQADALFDDMLLIADTPMLGEKVKELPGGKKEKTSGDMIEHRKLQVETRKWIAGKLRPKKYGDRTQMQLTGPDGEDGTPTAIQVTIVDPKR
ncbi:terminase small subunit protein [Brucella pituitosa]|uniref:terminase small subunit-like protein n=1 Tax=Brucella pituitosa TaxID=571256 RepID=UPI002003F8A2|nr:terminase small subunit protein [Brucella pituitosa]MCK4207187.1 terminase small subunit protein [Brucella pituitosa]